MAHNFKKMYNTNVLCRGNKMLLKRKLYKSLVEWKKASTKEGLIINGAVQVGKTTLVKEFAKNEFESVSFIDATKEVRKLERLLKSPTFSLIEFNELLLTSLKIKGIKENSLIVFDEIDTDNSKLVLPLISKLVALNSNYSFIGLRKNITVKDNIDESSLLNLKFLKLHPLDFEEFLNAINEGMMINQIKEAFTSLTPLKPELHQKAMHLLKVYMLVGGMPEVVVTYLETNSIDKCDKVKFEILNAYQNEVNKIQYCYKEKVDLIFDQMPTLLSSKDKRVIFKQILEGSFSEQYRYPLKWIENAMLANECFSCTNITNGITINETRTYVKCYLNDTGLLYALAKSKDAIENDELLGANFNLFTTNRGMFLENIVAQMLSANNHNLYFYTHYNNIKHRYDMELEFLLENNDNSDKKLTPIKVTSLTRLSNLSLDRFNEAHQSIIKNSYLVYVGNLMKTSDKIAIPPYMVICL